MLSCREFLSKYGQDLERVVLGASQDTILHDGEVLLNSTHVLVEADFVLFPQTSYNVFSCLNFNYNFGQTHNFFEISDQSGDILSHKWCSCHHSAPLRPHSHAAPVLDLIACL